jgi:O-antigen ligase
MNMLFLVRTRENYIYLSSLILTGLVLLAIVCGAPFYVAALLLLPVFVLLQRNPELALAILFNGVLIYLYTVYKMGLHTNRTMTGAFYAFLTSSFVLGEFLLFRKKHTSVKLGCIEILFCMFFLLFFLSYFAFSSDNHNAYRKITYAPLLAIMPFFGGRFLLSEIRIKKFLTYCALIAILLMIPAFYEHFCNPVLAQQTRFSMFSFENTELKDNPILFGGTYAVLLIIVFVWMLESRRFRVLHLVVITASAYLILLSGSRGVLVSLWGAIALYLCFASGSERKVRVSAFVFLLLVSFGIYKYCVPQRLSNFYRYSTSAGAFQDHCSSFRMRISMWKHATREFAENPVIGVGTGNSSNGSGYPHNIVLEVAAEFGVLGLIIFVLMIYATILKAIVFLRDRQLSSSHILMRILFVLFLNFLIHAMFSHHLANYPRLYISMGLIVCLDNVCRTPSAVE